MSSVKEMNHTGLCCAMKGYIVSQKKYSYFDPMNLVLFGLKWVPSRLHCNWSKILTAAIGKFLDQSGISKALDKSTAFLKGTAESSIMKGGDYIYGKDGMSVIAEAMTRLKFEALEQSESYCLNEGFINTKEIEHTIAAVASHTFSDTTAKYCENFNCA